MSTTTDRNDPDLNKKRPDGQNEKYLVLSEEERAKGFTRPYRTDYKHTKCGAVTTMGAALSETYARQPSFYTHTYCVSCHDHLPVSEFVWVRDGQVVGS